MTIETWLTFVLASLILTMTPGPSILLGVLHAMKHGPGKVVYTALGDISANFLQMVLVAVGLGVIIASSEIAFIVIKWLGVITLFYMGLMMLISPPRAITSESRTEDITKSKLYWSGFLVAAGNPKAIVFFTAFFPQFIDPSQPLFQQMAIMCPTMALLDFTWVMIYALSANRFLGFMHRHPSYINRAGGSALVAAAAFLSLSERVPGR